MIPVARLAKQKLTTEMATIARVMLKTKDSLVKGFPETVLAGIGPPSVPASSDIVRAVMKVAGDAQ